MGTRNTLGDLNNHLFMQMERLNDDDISNEDLEKEMGRTRAMESIAKSIIQNANLALEAQKFNDDKFDMEGKLPRMLEG